MLIKVIKQTNKHKLLPNIYLSIYPTIKASRGMEGSTLLTLFAATLIMNDTYFVTIAGDINGHV